ncbi:SLC13 family permease [Bacillus licheniformis]|nr:SLC13 family permease [Bacillus licheniformis]
MCLCIWGIYHCDRHRKWNLHKRMALHILKRIGAESHRIVLGVMAATAVLSMWISNAATALMMLPVALAVIKEVQEKKFKGESLQKFSKAFAGCRVCGVDRRTCHIGRFRSERGVCRDVQADAQSRNYVFEWFYSGSRFPFCFLPFICLFNENKI